MQLTEYPRRRTDHRSGDSFLYRREISKPFGGLDSVLGWCHEELISEWRWQLIDVSSDQLPGRYAFYFDTERDCVAFVLQWS